VQTFSDEVQPHRSVRALAGRIGRYLQKAWLCCALIGAIAVVARAPGLQGQHIWDDHYLAIENPFIKSPILALEAFRQYLFLDSFSTHYRPFQNVSYIFDYYFWGTDPYGFHLTNVLLHSACGVLLYLLLKHLFASLWFRSRSIAARERLQKRVPLISLAALLIALLWAVHPVHSAAVDYISGRADSLAFLLSAGAWLLFIRARACRRMVFRVLLLILAAFAVLMALCSRESAAMWLAIFLGHLFVVERNLSARARVLTLVACIALTGAYAGMRQLPGARPAPAPSEGWSAPMRAVLMTRALGDYTRLLVFPGNLHMERSVLNPAGFKDNRGWRTAATTEYLSLLGVLTLGVLAYGCTRPGAGQPARIFGASWFVAAYLPISNLLPLNATVAEHWLYLPSVGFLIFLAGCAIELPQSQRRVVVSLAIFVTLALTARSMLRSTDWANEETFYTRTLEAGGTSVRVAVNLAEVYSRKDDLAAAERVFRRVLEITPDYPMARNNLANLLQRAGRKEEAEQLFDSSARAAVETRKDYAGTWVAAVNLAKVRWQEGDNAGALALLRQAQADYPGNWNVIRMQAEILRSTGAEDAALQLVIQFAKKNWWHHNATMALGRLHAQRGDIASAEAALLHASRLDVHDTEALNLLATMRVIHGRLEEAAAAQRRAVARQPHQPRQYRMLSDILTQLGRADEAEAVVAQMQRLQTFAAATAPAQ
jgi:protein O-mannosyl-transferase